MPYISWNLRGIYKNTVILSCTTLLDYVQIAQKTCKTDFPVIELDRQYHVKSSQMRKHILHTLAGISPSVDTYFPLSTLSNYHYWQSPKTRY